MKLAQASKILQKIITDTVQPIPAIIFINLNGSKKHRKRIAKSAPEPKLNQPCLDCIIIEKEV